MPHPGMEPGSPASPALAGRFFTTSTTWEAHIIDTFIINHTTNQLPPAPTTAFFPPIPLILFLPSP